MIHQTAKTKARHYRNRQHARSLLVARAREIKIAAERRSNSFRWGFAWKMEQHVSPEGRMFDTMWRRNGPWHTPPRDLLRGMMLKAEPLAHTRNRAELPF